MINETLTVNQPTVSSLLEGQKVMPVVVIENTEQALGLAQAFIDGGIGCIEITLRNEYALTAIEEVKAAFPDMVLVAGTVNNAEDMHKVIEAGVDAVVSPGVLSELLDIAAKHQLPYLPGVATPSEIMLAMNAGLSECKLFPASVVGGIDALKAYSGPFKEVLFCPTGGIGSDDYLDYLALPNVMCVGGSWVAPSALIREQRWQEITQLCKALN